VLFEFELDLFVLSAKVKYLRFFAFFARIEKSKRIPSIFKDESTGSCICLWKLAVSVATYVSICIV
jgi:hypothetical protein